WPAVKERALLRVVVEHLRLGGQAREVLEPRRRAVHLDRRAFERLALLLREERHEIVRPRLDRRGALLELRAAPVLVLAPRGERALRRADRLVEVRTAGPRARRERLAQRRIRDRPFLG